jgi:hypothetical protein
MNRFDVLVAVLLAVSTAAVSRMRPPSLDDATDFIVTAVERHHVAPEAGADDRSLAKVAVTFAGCDVERRTEFEVRHLDRSTIRTQIERLRLDDIDVEAIDLRRGSTLRRGRSRHRTSRRVADVRQRADRSAGCRRVSTRCGVVPLMSAVGFRASSAGLDWELRVLPPGVFERRNIVVGGAP